MLLLLWFLAQLFVVLAMALLGPHLPQSPLEIVLLLVVGVAALVVPLVDRLFGGLRLLLKAGPHGLPAPAARGSLLEVDLPAAPGTPGTPLVRAPARDALRFA